jgi:hypothetical protein
MRDLRQRRRSDRWVAHLIPSGALARGLRLFHLAISGCGWRTGAGDHIPLALTDPLGVSNSIFERLWGIQTDIRVQLHLPTPAPYAHFNEPTARSLNRPQEQHRQSPGIGIEFVFEGRKRSPQSPR